MGTVYKAKAAFKLNLSAVKKRVLEELKAKQCENSPSSTTPGK